MKKFIAIIGLLALATGATAQDKFTVVPKARFEYVTSVGGHTMTPNGLAVGEGEWTLVTTDGVVNQWSRIDINEAPVINLGRFEGGMGIEFGYKGVGLLFDTDVYMGSAFRGAKKSSFAPCQANFTIKLQYQNPNIVKGLKVFISHTCYHPIQSGALNTTDYVSLTGYNGGVTKIGISFNY